MAAQALSPETPTAVSPACASDTAVTGCIKVPPRGVEQLPDSGHETRNPPPSGTESGTESGTPAADPLPELLAVVLELPPEAATLLLQIAKRLQNPPAATGHG
jgi:hypothetical protein